MNGELITADHITIATGGRPTLPNIEGAEYGIDSDGFFALTEQPKSVSHVFQLLDNIILEILCKYLSVFLNVCNYMHFCFTTC